MRTRQTQTCVVFDVGITTGFAIVEGVNAITWDAWDFERLQSACDCVVREWDPHPVVVELPLIYAAGGDLARELQDRITFIRGVSYPMAQRFYWISPDQWKSSPAARHPIKRGQFKTQHEKDAYRIGVWWNNYRGKKVR